MICGYIRAQQAGRKCAGTASAGTVLRDRRTACLLASRYLTMSDLRNRSGPPAAAMAGITANRQCRSFLRHSGLAQPGEIRGFEQGAGLRYPPVSAGLHVCDARKATVDAQPPGFGEFGGGAFGLAFEGIGGG